MSGVPRVAIHEVATLERDVVNPADIRDGILYVGLEHIENGGRFVGVGPVRAGELASSKFAFTRRHILYGKLRPYLAKIARPDFDGVCSTDILPVLPGPDLDRSYLAWLLLTPELVALANSRATGANLPRLSPRALAEFEIPLPPLQEQVRIANIIDKADALRAKREDAIAAVDDLVQSIFLDLFGNPIRNERNWPLVRLEEIAQVDRGKFTPRPRNDPGYYGGSFPFIQTGDISGSDGRLRSWRQTLNDRGTTVSRSFPAGTVVIAIVGATVGLTAILDVEVYCPDSVVGIQPDMSKASAEYLERTLRFWRPTFVAQAPETARANINLNTLRPLRVPLPPIALQREFVRRVTVAENLRAAQRASLADLDALFASLQHRAFRGEL